MPKFNMMDLLNNSSKDTTDSKRDKIIKFKTISISIENLVPSKENFYSTNEEGIKELKDSIEVFGLQQNLVAKKIDDNNYEIIAGHRRYLALKSLYEEGKEQFKYAPCKIETEEEDIRSKLLLLITNSTARELTDWEKTQQAEKLKELLIEYKKQEKLPGRVREIVADILNVATSKIARMESISKNLSDDLKEEFKENNINISTAYEASKLPEDKQEEIYEELKEKGDITIQDVKKKSEIIEERKEENVSNLDTNTIEEVNTETGEVVEQKIPSYLNKNMITFIKELSVDEFATFLCDRCTGLGGGNGCAGICDFAIECKGTNKHELCIRWLNQQI